MERRVLVIPADRSYITVEPGQTAESYTAGLRQKYITALVLAGAYALLYVAAWCVIWASKKISEDVNRGCSVTLHFGWSRKWECNCK